MLVGLEVADFVFKLHVVEPHPFILWCHRTSALACW